MTDSRQTGQQASDFAILYQLITRVDEKLDQFMERFVPRAEIESRFYNVDRALAASQDDRRALHDRLDELDVQRKADRHNLVVTMIYLMSAFAAVVGVVLTIIYHK